LGFRVPGIVLRVEGVGSKFKGFGVERWRLRMRF